MRRSTSTVLRLGTIIALGCLLSCGGGEEPTASDSSAATTTGSTNASNPGAAAAVAPTKPATKPTTPGAITPPAPRATVTTPTNTSQVAMTTGGPRFVLMEPIIDYGDIHDFEKRSTQVAFVNGGNAPLNVKQVQPTCGCTTVKLEKTVFAPGEGESITLNFSPKGTGQQSKIVKIHTNDPKKPITNLTIKANVLGTANASPRTFRLGKIKLGEPYSTSSIITAEDPRYVPTSVNVLGNISEYSQATLTEITPEGAGNRSWRVDLMIPEDTPWGWHTGSVNVRGTVKTEERVFPHRLSMGVNFSVEGDIICSDTMLRLLLLTPGQQISKSVTLTRSGDLPFEIINTKVLGNGANFVKVTATPTNSERNQWTLTMTGTAPDQTMVMQGDVEIITNIPGEDRINLRYMGNIRKSR